MGMLFSRHRDRHDEKPAPEVEAASESHEGDDAVPTEGQVVATVSAPEGEPVEAEDAETSAAGDDTENAESEDAAEAEPETPAKPEGKPAPRSRRRK